MPNRDGTGPEGKGPRSGKGLGPCAPNELQKKKQNTDRPRRNMGPRNRGEN